MEKKKVVYICGPMRGKPWYNFSAFDQVKNNLIANGFKVISPADLDRAAGFDPDDLPEDTDWDEFPEGAGMLDDVIKRDVEAIMKADALFCMHGYEWSTGCFAERALASWRGVEVFYDMDDLLNWRNNCHHEANLQASLPQPQELTATSTKVDGLDSGNAIQSFGTGAVRDTADNKPRIDLISPFAEERHGELMRKGAVKYAERNWEKGMPLSRFLASLHRHMNKFDQGDASEDHLAAIRFNVDGIMHGQEMIKRGVWPKEYDDLPSYNTIEESV